MTSPETFIAFAAIMIVIALIGAAIDWVGAPLRHRRFIPKAYRFPDERLFRNDNLHNQNIHVSTATPSSGAIYFKEEAVPIESEENFQEGNGIEVLILETPIEQGSNDGSTVELGSGPSQDHEDHASDQVEQGKDSTTVHDEIELPLQKDITSPKKQEGTLRLRGWKPSGYIYNLTQDGREPSPSTVKTRYWKNVGAASGSAIFGAQNIERMKEGKPPQRRNFKSGKMETMRISPKSYDESGGEIPIPYWPSNAVDPFGDPS
ncbi:MAG: hypothetical protein CL522_03050 [Actinobacteria bacterium]|nr:hypothetical protein [Actinomycetota bacterium]|tara:strand:+ start:1519 stop:2304 length:786 start_codon:yes stop_codon:yes gene_type:complete